MPVPDRPALVLIAGNGGSKLRDTRTGKLAWGSFWNIYPPSTPYALGLPLDGDPGGFIPNPLEVAGWLDQITIVPGLFHAVFYKHMVDYIAKHGNYRFGDLARPGPEDDLFFYAYDWRQDIATSARALRPLLDGVRRARGNPDLKFVLMGHSTGGTIVRYFYRMGELAPETVAGPPDPPAGAPYLHRAILVGVAARGTTDVIKMLVEGYWTTYGGSRMDPYILATLPSTYVALPSGPGLFVDESGAPLAIDIMEPEPWRRLGLGFHGRLAQAFAHRIGATQADMESYLARCLARAKRIKELLETPANDEYVIFASDSHPTPARVLVKRDGSLHFTSARSGTLELPGDSYATVASLRGKLDGEDGPACFRIRREHLGKTHHRWLMKDPPILQGIIEEAQS